LRSILSVIRRSRLSRESDLAADPTAAKSYCGG
jgi:hypothetical protein